VRNQINSIDISITMVHLDASKCDSCNNRFKCWTTRKFEVMYWLQYDISQRITGLPEAYVKAIIPSTTSVDCLMGQRLMVRYNEMDLFWGVVIETVVEQGDEHKILRLTCRGGY